jgi:signal transduction histidine kinase
MEKKSNFFAVWIQKLTAARSAVILGLFAAVVWIFFAIYLEQLTKKQDQEQASAEISRLTRVVKRTVELNFLSVDLMLRRATERQYVNELFGGNLQDDMSQHLEVWLREEPHIVALLATDAEGEIQSLQQKIGFADILPLRRGMLFPAIKHFDRHKDDESIELMISTAVTDSANQRHLIYISRRIEKIDGSFGGLMVAVMDGFSMTDYFRSVMANWNVKLAILLDQSKLLIDNSGLEPSEILIDSLKKEAAKIADRGEDVTVVSQQIDSESALFSYAAINKLPVMVALVMRESEILQNTAEARKNLAISSAIFMAVLLIGGAFLRILTKQMEQVRSSEEKALLASQAKSDFLAKMSHELRTPLNAVIGFSEMMGAEYFGSINEKQKDRLNDIHSCGTHLLELISDILDFSKGDAGKMTLYEEQIAIAPFLEATLRMISPRAQEKQIELLSKSPRNLPMLYADEKRLRQILLNLLSNAVKFTPAKGKITLEAYLDSAGKLVLSVEDSGIGMAAEDIPKALQLFEQVHRDGGYEGTGLGLPLAKMFAELHGGQFLVESELGNGTRVSVILPKDRLR